MTKFRKKADSCQNAELALYFSLNAMKTGIHPQYYPSAKIHCACGETFTVGSTKPDIKVEICYRCHPFYTGKEKLIDTAGKVEKFKARREKAAKSAQKVEKKPRVKKRQKANAITPP